MHLNEMHIDEGTRSQITDYVIKVDALARESVKARRAYEKISLPFGIVAVLPHIFIGAVYFGNVKPIKDMITIDIFIPIAIISLILLLIVYIKNASCKKNDTRFNDFFFGEVNGFLNKNQFRYVPPSFEYTFNARGKLTHIPTGVVCDYSPNVASNDNNVNSSNNAA